MPDNLTPEQRRRTMAAIKGRDTSLELTLHKRIQDRRWRCQRNVRALPGKPDFVFARARLAVFVDGDFWHGWRFPTWRSKLSPYWQSKIERNRRRDRVNTRRLRRAGWRVIRVWGHQIARDLDGVVHRISQALDEGRTT